MNELQLREYLERELEPERFQHSIAVMEMATLLAIKHGADVEKARLAALAHDCARGLNKQETIQNAVKYKVAIDEISMWEIALLHGPVGARMAEDIYSIHDRDILDAIECHTTGKKDMSLLDKIVYLADCIEPGRDFEKVLELRRLAMEDIDLAMRYALEFTISSLMDSGRLMHQRTMEARNQMIIRETMQEHRILINKKNEGR